MRTLLIALLLAATAVTTPQERVAATVAALNASPDAFEAYAREAFTGELLARGPEKRKALVERLRADFGKLAAGAIRRTSPSALRVELDGATGLHGALLLEHETDPPYRLTNLGVGVGAGAEERGSKLPPPPIRGDMKDAELAAALDPYLRQLTEDSLFSGSVLIAKDGKPLFERAYGLASRAYGAPNRTTTRFDIGSINKMFTKEAIGQLQAQGKLTPDDTIAKLIPDYPNADARKATISQLLEHRGGLADFFPKIPELALGRFRSNHDWYGYVAALPVVFEAGARRQYCNSCYIVLGEIIERLSGMPYEQYVQKNVFDAAGMKSSGFFHRDAVIPDVATGYTALRGGNVRTNAFEHGAAGSAAGGAYSTVGDLLAFDRKFGHRDQAVGYAGGAAGVNASVETEGAWTVIVLANIDPPAAEGLAPTLLQALQ